MEDKLDLFLKELAELTEKYGIARCPLVNEHGCLIISDENVLDLIFRQQERIEELELITGLANNRQYYRKFVDEVFSKQKGNELSEPDFDYIYQLYFEQQTEIERLESLLNQLFKDVDYKLQYIYELEKKLESDQSEAIKEFADRFIDEECAYCSSVSDEMIFFKKRFDNFLAEMVGGENA